jgi:hypothetical protein
MNDNIFDADGIYAIEGEHLATLWKLQQQLHAGSDRERDFGHKLWLVLTQAPFKLSEDEVFILRLE